jgi:formylglycine-generating enzyme
MTSSNRSVLFVLSCCLGLALALTFAPNAAAQVVALEWVIVGDQGNAGDPQPTCTQCGPSTTFGAVSYPYAISKFEITNQQYVDFLNAVAASDPKELYNFEMGLEEPPLPFYGGIVQEGTAGSFTYRVVPGRANKPVNYVGWYDALRFANWLHNGRPAGPQGPTTTEDGAYTITFAGILANSIVRNPGAQYSVPTENEWYKAASYRAATATCFDYPD